MEEFDKKKGISRLPAKICRIVRERRMGYWREGGTLTWEVIIPDDGFKVFGNPASGGFLLRLKAG